MKIRPIDLLILAALLLAGALYFVLPKSVSGADFVSGQTLDGYTFRDGFWWQGSTPYTLSRTPVYDSYGRCVRYYKNRFSRAAVYNTPEKVVEKTYVPPTQAEKPPEGWRNILAKAAIAQREFEQKQIAAQQEHREYLETVDKLGLGKPLSYPTGSAFGYKLSQFSHQYNPQAAQGDTLYGYSLNTLAESYGQADVNVWMQQYSRGIDNAQKSADKGLSGMLSAIQTEGANRQKVAEILALKALVETLNVPETTSKTEIEIQGTSQNGETYVPPAGVQAQGFATGVANVLQANCYKCHSPQGAQGILGKSNLFPGGVDLTQYPRFSYQQKLRVVETCKTGEMPKGGDPLGPAEMGLLYADLLSSRKD